MLATIFHFEKDYMADLELLPRSWPAWNFDVAPGGTLGNGNSSGSEILWKRESDSSAVMVAISG
jgi:hypothetical protein